MNDFQLNLTFNAPASRLYEALATEEGVKGWWTIFCEVSERVGGEAHFRFPKAGFFVKVRVATLDKDRLVEWDCFDSRHPVDSGFSDLRDWVGTRMRFEIEAEGKDQSRLNFQHIGLQPMLDCFDSCKSGWSFYLGQSLKGYLEQGQGKPFTDDSVDNINV